MKKVLLFAVLVALLAAGDASAQGPARDGFAGLLYDVDSATLTYCTTTAATQGPSLIMSQGGGSSANLVPSVASSAPFTCLAVGDVLSIQTAPGVYAYRAITTWTSANLVVVDSAITLVAGVPFTWYRNVCGTSASAGWVSVPSGAQRVGLTVQFEQGDITSLAARWECRPANTANIVIIYPGETSDCGLGGTLSTDRCTFAAAKAGAADGSLAIVDDAPVFGSCRVGLAYVGADASDAAATLEKVTVSVSVR